MKLKTKTFTAGIILTLFASTGYTGTISDSYATGDTLTATHLTNIKTQVNDNASNITANESTINTVDSGVASNATNISGNISSISTNATAISGNALNVSANASGVSGNALSISTNATGVSGNVLSISTNATGVSGNVSSISTNASDISGNELSISANATDISGNELSISTNATDIAALQSPSGSVSIHASNFQSEGVVSPCDWNVEFENGVRGFFNVSSDAECDAVSGIQIPDGVTVDSLSCTFFHANSLFSSQNVFAKLLSIDMVNFSQGTIFQTPPTTNIGRQTTTDSIVNDTTPFITTIDNALNTYAVKIYFAEGNLSSQLTFVGCSIGYN